jgi:hypothetical protein
MRGGGACRAGSLFALRFGLGALDLRLRKWIVAAEDLELHASRSLRTSTLRCILLSLSGFAGDAGSNEALRFFEIADKLYCAVPFATDP